MSEIDYRTRYETLVRQLENAEGQGIYPLGHLSDEDREGAKKTDAYKCGWNDYAIKQSHRFVEMIQRSEDGVSDDVTLLLMSRYCFLGNGGVLSLNMNDTWSWATSWLVEIPADQVVEVARLFRLYGNAGLMYWHSCQENDMRSEFCDNNRAIDFVRNEERIRREVPDHNKRAYTKVEYTIGG